MFKINWDVVMDKGHGHIGIGIIVRDQEGIVLAAWSNTKDFLAEPSVVEAFAGFYAMEFSREMSFYDIIFEGDALQIVIVVKADN